MKNSKEKVRKVLKQEAKKVVEETKNDIKKAIELINSAPCKNILTEAV
jgi:uncharacterized protein YjgD (DUF1641 family)